MAPNTRFRRRGGAYLAILGVAMLVSVIGMSALARVRIQLKEEAAIENGVAARLAARSAVDMALLAIYSNSNWRNDYLQDTWTSDTMIGVQTLSYKLYDEANASLKTDSTSPVRVYGRGQAGESTWIFSVLVQPPLPKAPPNLLSNGNIETGLANPWWESGDCGLTPDAAIQHAGAYCLLISARSSATAAARQTITPLIAADSSYRVSAWIRTRTQPEAVKVGVWIQSEAGLNYFPIVELAATTVYQLAHGTFTPTWSGSLLSAYLEIGGTTTYQEIAIDDVSLLVIPNAVGPVPGTWRRDPQ